VIAWLASQIFLTSDYPLAFKVIYGFLIASVGAICVGMWVAFGRATPASKSSTQDPVR
jgi:hypothetical protein